MSADTGFTPTASTVRMLYARSGGTGPAHPSTGRRAAEFDAWIAQHDREVQAAAFDWAAEKLRTVAAEVEASGRDDMAERIIVENTRHDATILDQRAAEIRKGGAA
jgi:hypothetical protein